MFRTSVSTVSRTRCFRLAFRVLLIPLLIGGGAILTGAEESADGRSSTLVVLAVGDPPVTRMESAGIDADGNALTQEAEVDPGALPPPLLHLDSGSPGESASSGVPVFLNEFSPPVHFRARDGVRVLHSPGDAAELIRLPPSREPGEHLLVLFPEPKTRSWKTLRCLVLPADWSRFPADSIRMINVCGFDALFEAGGRQWSIRPGQAELIRPGVDELTLPYRLFVRTDQGPEMLRRAALRIANGRRQTLVIHPCDPTHTGRSCASAHLVETRTPKTASGKSHETSE